MKTLAASIVPSPCRNICKLSRGLCTACGRTLAEIEAWPTADDDRRRAIVGLATARIHR